MTHNPNKLFPLLVTSDLAGTKKFYVDVCGFTPTVDMENYLQVRSGASDNDPELCFMTPDAMPDGANFPRFEGKGVVMSIPTPNADTQHAALQAKGGKPINAPSSKPWGWRSFLIADPNGLLLDFFHVEKDNPMLHASS